MSPLSQCEPREGRGRNLPSRAHPAEEAPPMTEQPAEVDNFHDEGAGPAEGDTAEPADAEGGEG